MRQIVVLYQDDQVRLVYRRAVTKFEDLRQQDIEVNTLTDDIDYPLAYHVLPTPGPALADLQKADPYFDGVKDYADWKSFVAKVKERLQINSSEVASFLQGQYHIGAFAIQKIMYYAYADSVVKDGKPWFSSNFVAFDHGPVDQRSYYLLRDHPEKTEEYRLVFLDKADLKQIEAISAAVKKYGRHFAKRISWDSEVDNPTHRKGTPWSIAHEQGQNTPITDQDIIKYHKLEAIS